MKMATCHPDKREMAKGLCSSCYGKARRPATCHPDKPEAARGLCRVCYRREWRKEHPGAEVAYHKNNPKRATCHPDRPHFGRGLCSACAQREWYAKNRLQQNARILGVDANEILRALETHDGTCDACGVLPPKDAKHQNALQIDHCHDTGRFRGFLCGHCNKSLGLVGDSIERVRQLLAYLEQAN